MSALNLELLITMPVDVTLDPFYSTL